ncbi:ferritin-like domain-containing protein [Dendrosporobacter sp. 1207_IL3150]|uniref:ferritin-like domain-containing protein n=1 Tax=Dendrosporobacter sp. 1207_IL3150 TaxID=3084054 RepID=UPI002FD9EF69
MKENLFSDLEGLRIAIEIEARGRDFYQAAYNKVEKEEHKNAFMLLKNEELHHLEKFTKIFNKIKENKEADSAEYLFDQETSRYLTVLAEDHIFPKSENADAIINKLTTIDEILRMAIQAEKDSIIFYDELSLKAKFEDSRKIFTILKAEEQTHVVKLREMLHGWA